MKIFRESKRSWFLGAALVASTVVAASEPARSPRAEPRFRLDLGGQTFDPLSESPTLPEGWRPSGDGTREDLHLVQFDGPIPRGALADLEARGLEIVQYIHPHTYAVWGRATDRAALDFAGPIRWAGDFAPGFRVQPQWRNLPADVVRSRVLIYRGANPDSVVGKLVSLGAALGERRPITEEFELVGLSIAGDRLRFAAAIPGVYTIQLPSADGASRGEVAGQISAGNVDVGNIAQPGYPAWLASVGLDGAGVVVALVDEGVDETHPDVADRMLPCVGDTCAPGKSDHGTHTAGTLVGDASTGTLSVTGFLRGQGTAPGAMLFEQDWRLHYTAPGGMLKLMTQSIENGAVLSNNSWGPSPGANGYDLDTLLVDVGVRDADPRTAGSQSLIYIQAIDNGNGGISTQGTPDDAKNTFTVGSTKAVNDGNGAPTADIDDVSFNSAHGPALDGRTIPQIVAPGCYVDGPIAFIGGEYDHSYRCGTSMAAAHLSGAVALFVEYHRNLFSADPSPALVKAAFLPVAHDLDGNLDADDVTLGHRPDSKQGWGRLNLAAAVDPPDPVLYFDQMTVFDFTGQEWARVVTQANPAEPMRIMLAWTDAPGHGLGGNTPAWNNDLDLSVESGGQSYLGNDFGADGFSTIGGVADGRNNTEGVMLQTVTGNATIRVAATDINSNGVPHHGDRTDQDFALVCYNCALVPDFSLAVDPAPFRVCSGTPGELQVEVAQLAGFAENVTLSALGLPAGAGAVFSANPITPPAAPLLAVDPGTAVDGDYTLDVQGDSTTLSRTVSAGLILRTASPAAAALTSPLDLAIDVPLNPLLEWSAVPWTDRYLVEIATAPDFRNIVYSGLESSTGHRLDRPLTKQTTYFWRVRGNNACGYGAVSAAASFTTQDVPDLLLVDDDYDLPNEQTEYTTALDNLGVSYDVWDVWAEQGELEPAPDDLAPYKRIIWWSGREEVYPGPDDDSERDLPGWLDRGGCMLLSSLDYLLAQGGVTDFMAERLGVASVVEDSGMGQVTGAGSVFSGLGPWVLDNINPDYRDAVSPDATAELAFGGDLGDAGINKDGGWYRTAFFGFGAESVSTPETQAIFDAFLTWCAGLSGIDGDGDGILNDGDCVAGDAGAWEAPHPIDDLLLGKGAVGFSWSEPVSGSGSSYDLLRSADQTDFYNADCVLAGTSPTSGAEDLAIPAPGELFFYLVGATSECGLSTLGHNLDGTPRYGTACDAEVEWW